MAIAFTRNYTDHSNDSGYQFEFHCDKCGNGFRSAFQTSSLGVVSSLFRAAGNLFGGGALSSVGDGADYVKDALRGPAWDSSFKAAVSEIKPKFHQCTRCGHWVCPDVCWNEARQLCEDCAPDLGEEAAAAQALAAREQLHEKARNVDQTDGTNLKVKQTAACPSCKARLAPNAKFCGSCGKPVPAAAAKRFCGECGEGMAPGAKFCPGCGVKAS